MKDPLLMLCLSRILQEVPAAALSLIYFTLEHAQYSQLTTDLKVRVRSDQMRLFLSVFCLKAPQGFYLMEVMNTDSSGRLLRLNIYDLFIIIQILSS